MTPTERVSEPTARERAATKLRVAADRMETGDVAGALEGVGSVITEVHEIRPEQRLRDPAHERPAESGGRQ